MLQKIGGVSRYFSSLMAEFAQDPKHEIRPFLTFKRSGNIYLQKLTNLSQVHVDKERIPYLPPVSPWKTLLTLGPIHDYWLSISAGAKIARPKLDLLHATYYRPTTLERSRSKKIVTTIHDFIPERLGWTWVRNPHIGKRELVDKASLILCVSKATADDLKEFYQIEDSRVRVIGHGVSYFGDANNHYHDTKRPKILYVGHRGGYKNFEVLVKAVSILDDEGRNLEVCTVGPAWTGAEEIKFKENFRNVSWSNEVEIDDTRLTELYGQAKVLCFTSTMEGFGLPILEALAMGTRVIASDIAVFREVGAGMIEYFNPKSEEELAFKLGSILDSEEQAESIRARIDFARENSWSKVATKVASAYKDIQ